MNSRSSHRSPVSFPPLRASSYFTLKKALTAFFITGGMMSSAFAGASAIGDHALSINIAESTGTSWAMDLSSVLTYDSSTGSLNMPTVGTALSGNWSWGKVDVLNAQSNQLEQKDGLIWHSSERNEDNTAWRSNVSLYATGNVDPFMSYGFLARNTTTTVQNYSFSFSEAITPPVGGNYRVSDAIVGVLTNGVAGTTAQIAPTRGDLDGDGIAEVQSLSLSANHGVGYANAGVDVGPAFTTGTAAGPTAYGLYTATKTGVSAPSLDYWKFDLQFSLTPGRDAAALSGFALINAVAIPEPSTYALLVSATVLGLVLVRNRRARLI